MRPIALPLNFNHQIIFRAVLLFKRHVECQILKMAIRLDPQGLCAHKTKSKTGLRRMPFHTQSHQSIDQPRTSIPFRPLTRYVLAVLS